MTGSPSPSISRTGSQGSRAAAIAPLPSTTSVDRARSSPSPLIMAQTVAPPDVRQHDWAAARALLIAASATGAPSHRRRPARTPPARPAAPRCRPGSPRPSQRHRQPHRPRHTAKERTVLDLRGAPLSARCCPLRTGLGPAVVTTLRNLAISPLRHASGTNSAAACRPVCRHTGRVSPMIM